MNDQLLEIIRERVLTHGESAAFTPTSEEMIVQTELHLGFKLPLFLRAIYSTVANGGFGPGYGIIGLNGGRSSNLGTLAETYDQVKEGAKYLGLDWKKGLLPFCEWGGNIFSCVDCDVPHLVYQSEECDARMRNYNIDDFFRMWLDGIDILKFEGGQEQTVEIVNPFTGAKAHVRMKIKK